MHYISFQPSAYCHLRHSRWFSCRLLPGSKKDRYCCWRDHPKPAFRSTWLSTHWLSSNSTPGKHFRWSGYFCLPARRKPAPDRTYNTFAALRRLRWKTNLCSILLAAPSISGNPYFLILVICIDMKMAPDGICIRHDHFKRILLLPVCK